MEEIEFKKSWNQDVYDWETNTNGSEWAEEKRYQNLPLLFFATVIGLVVSVTTAG